MRLPVPHDHVLAVREGRISLDPELPGERVHSFVAHADPGTAEVGGRAILEVLRPDAPADAVARLEHDDLVAGAAGLSCGGEAGVAGPHDADASVTVGHG